MEKVHVLSEVEQLKEQVSPELLFKTLQMCIRDSMQFVGCRYSFKYNGRRVLEYKGGCRKLFDRYLY